MLAGALIVTSAAFGAALAQDSFPSKPIKVVVGFAPGGPSDLIARVVGSQDR